MNETQRLKLYIQSALLGQVTPNLFAVTASISGRSIKLRFYFGSTPTDEDVDCTNSVGGEVIANYPDDFCIDEEIHVAKSYQDVEVLDFFAFLRAF